jgi:hypothetical protein
MPMIPDRDGEEKLDARLEGKALGESTDLCRKSCPSSVRKLFEEGETSEGWSVWLDYLAERDCASPLDELLSELDYQTGEGSPHPIFWGTTLKRATGDSAKRLRVCVKRLEAGENASSRGDKSLRDAADAFLQAVSDGLSADGGPSGSFALTLLESLALESLAWAHLLPTLGTVLGAEWPILLDAILDMASDADTIDHEDEPLAWQLLGVELSWTLACQFPELKPCWALIDPGLAALKEGLDEILDGAGHPHACDFERLRPLLACWTRCKSMSDHLPRCGFKKRMQGHYEWAIRAALRTSRPDGASLFQKKGEAWSPSLDAFFRAAVAQSTDEDDLKIFTIAMPGDRGPKAKRIRQLELPESSHQSEWAETSILRTNWSADDPILGVLYNDQKTRLEFTLGSNPFISGEWKTSITLAGAALEPLGPWEEVCRLQTDDVEYVELEQTWSESLRVQRHVLLTHDEEFVLVADALLGATQGAYRYEATFPLYPGVTTKLADESRELTLVQGEAKTLVLPLALSEWKADVEDGELSVGKNGLTLVRKQEGGGLFAPLLIDFNKKRTRAKRLTWRRLTVAEKLRIVGPDEAVGYRAQIDDDQFLFYRSLVEPENRTVLGRNLICEHLVARFQEDGSVDDLLEVGGPEEV